MLKRVKVESPSVYNGKADLDVFDCWTMEVENWAKLNRIKEKIVVTLLNKYITSRASIFYMKYVVRRIKDWTLKSIFEGLFNFCFPREFKANLRRKLMTTTQGKAQITEFIRDIELMADRFPDVNECGIIEIFWWGMHQNTRSRVLEMGAHPERSTMEKLVKCAVRVEDGILDTAANRQQESGWTWDQFASRTNASRSRQYRPPREEVRTEAAEGRDQVRVNAVTPQP